MAMFKDPILAPPKNKKVRNPFDGQPSYDDKHRKMYPAGDYYGTGFKAKVGHLRGEGSQSTNIPQKAFRKDPKSVA